MESFLEPWKKTHTYIHGGEVSEWDYKKEDVSFRLPLEVLARIIGQEIEIKGIRIRKKVKQLFVSDILVYVENSKDTTTTNKNLVMDLARSQDTGHYIKNYCISTY